MAAWTTDEDNLLRELVAAGVSQADIGRRLDRSPGSVAGRKARLGIQSERGPVVAATQARVIDAKARRTALEVGLLEDAEKLRQQIWQPHTYFDWGGKDHTFDTHETTEPTPTDKLKLMQAAGAAIDRSIKIASHDTDTGVAEAVGILDLFAVALQETANKSGLDQSETP